MSPAELVAELERRGVELQADGERLRFRAPKTTLNPALKAAIAEHKAAILEMLTTRPTRPCWCCHGTTVWWREVLCDNGRWSGDWLCSTCHPDPAKEH